MQSPKAVGEDNDADSDARRRRSLHIVLSTPHPGTSAPLTPGLFADARICFPEQDSSVQPSHDFEDGLQAEYSRPSQEEAAEIANAVISKMVRSDSTSRVNSFWKAAWQSVGSLRGFRSTESQASFSRSESASSYRELPPASNFHKSLVIATMLLAAVMKLVAIHIAVQWCWNTSADPRLESECGGENQDAFRKPWFTTWSSFLGQSVFILLFQLRQLWKGRQHASDPLDSNGSFHFARSDVSSGADQTGDYVNTFLCGCCCGYQVIDDPEFARAEGIKTKVVNGLEVGAVPMFLDSKGQRMVWTELSWLQKHLVSCASAVTDVCCTAFEALALLFISPSLVVMLKSLSLVWVSLLSTRLLPGRQVFSFQYFAVCVAVVGGTLVAGAALMQQASENAEKAAAADAADGETAQGGGGNVAFGILFSLLAGLSSAIGSISMEKIMKESEVPSTVLAGINGLQGMVMSSILVTAFHFAPGSDGGRVEDMAHTLRLLWWNPGLLACLILYSTVASGLDNWAITEAARILSSVSMLLNRNLVTFLLWGIELGLFYAVAGGRLGEEFLVGPGMLKLTGFATMTAALLVFIAMIRVPCFTYELPDDDDDRDEALHASSKHLDAGHAESPAPRTEGGGASVEGPCELGMGGSEVRRLKRTKAIKLVHKRRPGAAARYDFDYNRSTRMSLARI